MDLVDINKSGKVDFTGENCFNNWRVYNSCHELRKITLNRKNEISLRYYWFGWFLFFTFFKDGDKFISKAELENTMGGLDD